MQLRLVVAAVLGLFIATVVIAPASAQVNTAARIQQCIADNKDEEQEPGVLRAYCGCMSRYMGPNETKSISEWERTHKKEEEVCADRADWED